MENGAGHGNNHSKRSVGRSSHNHLSMSDTDSTASQVESWHSPLRSDSPLPSDDPSFQQENDHPGDKNLRSLVSLDRYYSPAPSPGKKSNFAASSWNGRAKGWRQWPRSEKPISENRDFPPNSLVSMMKSSRGENPLSEKHQFPTIGTSPVVLGLNRFAREEPPHEEKKVGADLEQGYGCGGYGENEVGGERRSRAAVESILRRSERSAAMKKLGLVFRVLEFIVCLISFSIMACNKTQGWSGDSFDRYKEYRYCLVVNIIGFVYSGLQMYDLACTLGTGKHTGSSQIRCQFDFSMDQTLAYLLMSASSSAATRVVDWISNWGNDQFTLMATASISMSFLAFGTFALSSLVSVYNLFNHGST